MNEPKAPIAISEFLERSPDVDVQEVEYKRLLGYPSNHELEGRAKELARWARQWYGENGNPWFFARNVAEPTMVDGAIYLDGAVFSCKRLSNRLEQAQANSVMLVAVSAGKKCEETARQLWNEGKPDEYFFLEVYGSAVVEHLVAQVSFRLCEIADRQGYAVLPHYSPGYPGWTIKEQAALLNLITQSGRIELPERVEVLESGMLRPKKSLLAVFGISRHLENVQRLTEMIPCTTCSLPACQYRRTPRKRSLPQLEMTRNLVSGKLLRTSAVPKK